MSGEAKGFDMDADRPPAGSPPLAQALWWDAKGDWTKAHDLVADEDGPLAARIYAYLHRKEGDLGNARYWYARGGIAPFTGSLQDEWQALVAAVAV